jgi:hypothetical protein
MVVEATSTGVSVTASTVVSVSSPTVVAVTASTVVFGGPKQPQGIKQDYGKVEQISDWQEPLYVS